jgi:secreted trypsin-like serine protease
MIEKSENQWTQIGIVSYGRVNCIGIGIYTKVAYYNSWIMDKITNDL